MIKLWKSCTMNAGCQHAVFVACWLILSSPLPKGTNCAFRRCSSEKRWTNPNLIFVIYDARSDMCKSTCTAVIQERMEEKMEDETGCAAVVVGRSAADDMCRSVVGWWCPQMTTNDMWRLWSCSAVVFCVCLEVEEREEREEEEKGEEKKRKDNLYLSLWASPTKDSYSYLSSSFSLPSLLSLFLLSFFFFCSCMPACLSPPQHTHSTGTNTAHSTGTQRTAQEHRNTAQTTHTGSTCPVCHCTATTAANGKKNNKEKKRKKRKKKTSSSVQVQTCELHMSTGAS